MGPGWGQQISGNARRRQRPFRGFTRDRHRRQQLHCGEWPWLPARTSESRPGWWLPGWWVLGCLVWEGEKGEAHQVRNRLIKFFCHSGLYWQFSLSSPHSFIPQMFTDPLLCARHPAGLWGQGVELIGTVLGAHILLNKMIRITITQLINCRVKCQEGEERAPWWRDWGPVGGAWR